MKKKMGWAKNTKSQDFKMLRFSEFLRGAWRGVAGRVFLEKRKSGFSDFNLDFVQFSLNLEN